MIKNIIETRKQPHGVVSLCGCVVPSMRMIDDPFKNTWNYVNSEILGYGGKLDNELRFMNVENVNYIMEWVWENVRMLYVEIELPWSLISSPISTS